MLHLKSLKFHALSYADNGYTNNTSFLQMVWIQEQQEIAHSKGKSSNCLMEDATSSNKKSELLSKGSFTK